MLVRPSRPALATSHRLWGVRLDTGWVVVDSAQANAAVHAALLHGGLRWPGLPGPWRREVALGGVRIDFASESDAGAAAWLETKCVTLVEAGVALFPDAPSRRAERQLQALVEERRRGARVIWLFLVQRSDATAFAVHAGHDPRFASAVEAARAAGVEFLAYGCRVRPGSMAVAGPLPFVDEKSVTSRTSTRSSEST